MRCALLIVVGTLVGTGTAACYAPTAATGAPCSVDLDNCPEGQHCEIATGNDGTCQSRTLASIDGPAGSVCFGTGTVKNVCFDANPGGSVKLGGTLDTSIEGGANCTRIDPQTGPQTGGPSLCIVAAESISVDLGVTATAKGPNALVLVASSSIAISGTLDVASHGAGGVGAGSQTTCGVALLDGEDATGMDGGGGAAGGSFGSLGANGGKGNGGSTAGVIGTTQSPTTIVGGCPGGAGGTGIGGLGAGKAGAGGGAVYLVAPMIMVTGTVDASGAGGGPGIDGLGSGGGGGGGGSGGFIGLDAPSLTVTGSIFANGGGAGGGNGNDFNKPGSPGADPQAPMVVALGGDGGDNGGGKGGAGFAAGILATPGANGSSTFCGGGGGGGGAGIIRVFQSTVPVANVSPTPSS